MVDSDFFVDYGNWCFLSSNLYAKTAKEIDAKGLIADISLKGAKFTKVDKKE